MSKQFSTLQALLDSILQMKRSDANKFLSGSCKNYFPQHLIKRYEEIKEKELFHIKHVRKCMEKLKADGTPNRHDHTKDAFYIFITSCHFNLNDECTVPPEILKSVIAQHHKAERHHPEYEKYNPKKELGNDDIMEMAVDRLSRNLQANQGEFNNQNIEQYMPSFPKNHKKKIEIYKEYVKALQPMVKATFQELQSTN
jgi:hypothetical protein